VKGSFFVLLRLFVDVMPPDYLGHTATVLGVLGATAIVWGSVLAAKQVRLKMLVAYSTVAPDRLSVPGVPTGQDGGPGVGHRHRWGARARARARRGESAMFLTAGGFLTRYGTDEIGVSAVRPVRPRC